MKNALHVRIESPAFEPGSVEIASLTGREGISRLFEFELRLLTLEGALDEEKLLTSLVTLVFELRPESGEPKELRRITGIIRTLLDRALSESNHRDYHATLVPRAWHATLTSTSDVCMDKKVPDIVTNKLQEGAGLKPGGDVELRLMTSYPPREFVVQYKETHFAFVSRLAEDLGIHYFFEEADDKDILVFGDDNSAFKPALPATAQFSGRGQKLDIFELEVRRQIVTKDFVARDYNYRNPGMDVLGEATTPKPVLGMGKVDEYGPHAKTPEEAKAYATLRAQEATVRSLTFEGKSALPGLRAGSTLTIEDHPRGKLDLVITEVVHDVAQSVFGAVVKERAYTNSFRAIEKAVVYRPERVTPKPVVSGVVTGIVESSSSTQMGAIDDQGRYRVAFMYDSVGDRDDGKASRPLRMAQPSAGSDRGFHIPLKVGTEVLVTCVNGDPDRPIIAGAVPNPQTPSPVSSANAEYTVLKSNVSHLKIDDQKPNAALEVAGGEHILHLGEPHADELGIIMGTAGNVATMASGVATEYSAIKTAYSDYKTSLQGKDILNAAGVPNPWSAWKKLETVAEGAIGFAKALGEVVDAGNEAWASATSHAREDKKEADDAAKEAKKKAVEDLGIEKKAKPQKKVQPDGTAKMETEEEAQTRTLDEELAKPQNAKKKAELDAATENSAKADEEVHALEEGKIHKAAETTKELAEKAEKGVKAIGKAGEGAAKAIEWLEKHEKLAEKIKKLPGAEKLISKISKIFGEAANEALDAVVMASQKLAAAVPLASRQRHVSKIGSFRKPYNIQFSRDSAALYGKNAFVGGIAYATVFSPVSANLLSEQHVNVKARARVEIAAKDVVLTAPKNVDVHSSGKVRIVAHTEDKDVTVPGGFNMYLHAKQGIMMDSVENDIEAKAKKNVKVTAEDHSVEFKAKENFKVETSDKNIELTATKGKVEIVAKDGEGLFRAKKKAILRGDTDVVVLADEGKGTVKVAKDLKIKSESGEWKTSGNIEFKVSTFTVNGSKVELG